MLLKRLSVTARVVDYVPFVRSEEDTRSELEVSK